LGRWFDADIRVASSTLARRRVSAVYSDPTLAGVLDALGATMGFTYERNGRVVTIRPKAR
jgi:ferric-dicitrate binding protein FerR (iron transport regulator)